jgi:hypothetical protein
MRRRGREEIEREIDSVVIPSFTRAGSSHMCTTTASPVRLERFHSGEPGEVLNLLRGFL